MSDEKSELARLRNEIDRIDHSMHELLMERGRMISALQNAKGVGAQKGSGAMRPAREARMMNAIEGRHEGPLPLAVAERIWREIIAAFTQLQAGFDVYATGPDKAALAEMTRFYFGVTTKVSMLDNVDAVIDKTQTNKRAVGFIAGRIACKTGTPWWVKLARMPDRQARVVARYPFFDGYEENTWGMESWLVSQAPFEPSGDDCTLIAIDNDPDNLDAVTAGIKSPWVEVDRALVDGETSILLRIEAYLGQDEIAGKIPAQASFVHLGGYSRFRQKKVIAGNRNDE